MDIKQFTIDNVANRLNSKSNNKIVPLGSLIDISKILAKIHSFIYNSPLSKAPFVKAMLATPNTPIESLYKSWETTEKINQRKQTGSDSFELSETEQALEIAERETSKSFIQKYKHTCDRYGNTDFHIPQYRVSPSGIGEVSMKTWEFMGAEYTELPVSLDYESIGMEKQLDIALLRRCFREEGHENIANSLTKSTKIRSFYSVNDEYANYWNFKEVIIATGGAKELRALTQVYDDKEQGGVALKHIDFYIYDKSTNKTFQLIHDGELGNLKMGDLREVLKGGKIEKNQHEKIQLETTLFKCKLSIQRTNTKDTNLHAGM
jgi:hypothetical protein